MTSSFGSRRGGVVVAVAFVLATMTVFPQLVHAQSVAGSEVSSAAVWQQTVMTWGNNWAGELADGTSNARSTPAAINLGGIVAVAAGEHHFLFLDSAGQVWSAGLNR